MAQSAKPIRSTAIRDYCKACAGDDRPRDCELSKCALYRFRLGTEDKSVKGHRITRGEAIKQFCRECVCGSGKRVANLCASPRCLLYPFRL